MGGMDAQSILGDGSCYHLFSNFEILHHSLVVIMDVKCIVQLNVKGRQQKFATLQLHALEMEVVGAQPIRKTAVTNRDGRSFLTIHSPFTLATPSHDSNIKK
jgi:hypothetical protein